MRSLSRAIRARFAGGEPMPSVFPELTAQGADARRGEVLMILGQPSAGKSAVALWYAIIWTWVHGLKGLYFSADTTAKPAAGRAASMILGTLGATKAQEELEGGNPNLLSVIDDLSHRGMEWAFDPDISTENLTLNLHAFEEKWGEVPAYIIVDNLSDVETRDGSDEGGALRGTVRDLNYLVRKINAAGVVLHHTSEGVKEDPVPPRSASMFKVSVKPTVILSTARTDGDRKKIGIVKNRYGYEDRFGHNVTTVPFDPDTLQFSHTPLSRSADG